MENQHGTQGNATTSSWASTSIAALAVALAKAQGEMRHAAKDNVNPHFRSRYADLAGVIDACREPLAKNGLSWSQLPTVGDGQVRVRTVLMHASGEWISSELSLPVSKHDAQGIGSAITYARRYALSAMVGVAQDDDDGNAAAAAAPKGPPPVDVEGAKREARAANPAATNGDGAPPERKSATARLLEFKRAIDSCGAEREIAATLDSWAAALERFPSQARKVAHAYARSRSCDLANSDVAPEDAKLVEQLNELAKE
jgi:hypothetical protein